MASMIPPASSGPGGVGDEFERKRKRMVSNRESARRSRMKKQQRVDGLVSQKIQLQAENKFIQNNINAVTNLYIGIESQNNVLRTQIAELTERLHLLDSVLEIAQQASNPAMYIPEIPDILLDPWQLPYPLQHPVGASSDMFHF